MNFTLTIILYSSPTLEHRTDDACNDVYTGAQPHPLIELQLLNQTQILVYNVNLVPEAILCLRPFAPAETFLLDVKKAALRTSTDPPLTKFWAEFLTAWQRYKSAQRKIYVMIVATLHVGTSMHYARSVPYGYGTQLLANILHANRHNTTRALFALFSSLFTLKLKPGETFETFNRRFDLVINRFANWDPPIILPEQLLLFFVLRGLSPTPYGPVTHIVLVSENMSLQKGLRLLRDVRQSEVGLINDTMGSSASNSVGATNAILAISGTPSVPSPAPATLTQAQKDTAKEA